MREAITRLRDFGITVITRRQPEDKPIEFYPQRRRVFVDAGLTNEETQDGLWQVVALADLDHSLTEGTRSWLNGHSRRSTA